MEKSVSQEQKGKRNKVYYEKNKVKLKLQASQYYQQTKDKLIEKSKQKYYVKRELNLLSKEENKKIVIMKMILN